MAPSSHRATRNGLLLGMLFSILIAVLIMIYAAFWTDQELPWGPGSLGAASLIMAALLAVVVSRVSINKEFDLFHPLVWAAWVYFVPYWVAKPLWMAFARRDSIATYLMNDSWYFLTMSMLMAVLGYVCLVIGFSLPFGQRFGRLLAKLPLPNWHTGETAVLGIVVLVCGFAASLLSFLLGSLGYVFAPSTSSFGTALNFISRTATYGAILVWFSYFAQTRKAPILYVSIIVALVTSFALAGLRGTRSALMGIAIVIMFAYQYGAFRKRWFTIAMLGGALLPLAVTFGLLFGSSFRDEKTAFAGYEGTIGVSELAQVWSSAIRGVSQVGGLSPADFLEDLVFRRLSSVDNLAVILANHERLAQMERAVGLEGNILTQWSVAFVPRFLWPDKPEVGNYGLLFANVYFGKTTTAEGMTAMGDLWRNFGIIGVILGMGLLGVLLRSVYTGCITLHQHPSPAWLILYYALIGSLADYEGRYLELGILIRSLLPVLLALLIVEVFVRFHRRRNLPQSHKTILPQRTATGLQ